MKKIITVILLTLTILSCSEGHLGVMEEQLTCSQEINNRYSKLIVEEALSKGWVPNNLEVNTDNPFEPGFLNIFHDPNIRIYRDACMKYQSRYNEDLKYCN